MPRFFVCAPSRSRECVWRFEPLGLSPDAPPAHSRRRLPKSRWSRRSLSLHGKRSRQQIARHRGVCARTTCGMRPTLHNSRPPIPAWFAWKTAWPFPSRTAAPKCTLSWTTWKPSPRSPFRQWNSPLPVSFKNEILAALTKAGCNMGACHGSPSGKAGFRLSLRGFDPELDLLTLRTEFYGRRTNVLAPEDSLILRKGSMKVAHGGGRRLKQDGPAYTVLRDWIGEGMQVDAADVPNLVKIEVHPKKRIFQPGADRQQLQVTGYFSDGKTRDLTALTSFSSSNESVGTVSPDGRGRTRRTRGDGDPLPLPRPDGHQRNHLPRRSPRLRLEQSARSQLRRSPVVRQTETTQNPALGTVHR